MAREAFSDEDLMAYADGELDVQTARALEAALDRDPELAERLKIFTGTRDALAELSTARPLDPMSDAAMERIRATLEASRAQPDDTVVPLQTRQPKSSDPAAPVWRPAALAASLALAVGLGAGYFAARDTGPESGRLQVALLEAEGLEPALSELMSGEEAELPGGVLRVIASFRDDRGAFCREFEFDATGGRTVVAVTCRDGSVWDTRLAIAANAADDTSYAPASSLDTLEAYLMAIGAGPVLSEEDEAAALASSGN